MGSLDELSEPILEYVDSARILDLFTQYVEKQHAQKGKIEHPRISKDPEGNVNIYLDGEINIKEMLPEIFVFCDRRGFVGCAIRSFDNNNHLTRVRVDFDYNTFEKNEERALCVIAHEIGHVLADEHVNLEAEKNEIDLGGYSEPFERVEDFENELAIMLHHLSIYINGEVQAYNYGKIVVDSFGVDQTTFEYYMEPALRSHVTDAFYHCRQFVTKMLADLEKSTGSKFSTEKTFKIYDTSLQEDVEVTFEELIEILGRYDEKEFEMAKDAIENSERITK